MKKKFYPSTRNQGIRKCGTCDYYVCRCNEPLPDDVIRLFKDGLSIESLATVYSVTPERIKRQLEDIRRG